MSKNIIEIKQSDSISKESFSKIKIIADRSLAGPKVLCRAKKIPFILLLIFLILGLFISSAYLLLSKNSNFVNDSSHNFGELPNEKIRANQQLSVIDNGDIIRGLSSRTINEGGTSSRTLNEGGTSITDYKRNVLLITNYLSKKGKDQNNISPDVLYNILNQMKKVTLTVLDAYDSTLNAKGIDYLKKFHLVALDFIDAGYNLASRCPNFTKALMQYVKEGGALFSSHDQFDETDIRSVTQEAIEMLKLLGFIHQNSFGRGEGSIAYFDQTAISNSIFIANQAVYGDSIPISYTHQTFSRYDDSCTTCKVIMKFSPSGSNSYEYLVINRPFKGKTVNIRAGHSYQFTEEEKKIFLSSILWLLYEI